MEASQEDGTYNNDHSAVSLANPLLESTTNSETKVQTTSQSFNYYTNPMAAYYGNKHRSQVRLQKVIYTSVLVALFISIVAPFVGFSADVKLGTYVALLYIY
ncbi:putative protein SICKLE [Helianthus annuus]|nr:putative protein SICKLE [Helianthus annuus]